jgi:hypothetical protein
MEGKRVGWKVTRGSRPELMICSLADRYYSGFPRGACEVVGRVFDCAESFEAAEAWVAGYERHPDAQGKFEPTLARALRTPTAVSVVRATVPAAELRELAAKWRAEAEALECAARAVGPYGAETKDAEALRRCAAALDETLGRA